MRHRLLDRRTAAASAARRPCFRPGSEDKRTVPEPSAPGRSTRPACQAAAMPRKRNIRQSPRRPRRYRQQWSASHTLPCRARPGSRIHTPSCPIPRRNRAAGQASRGLIRPTEKACSRNRPMTVACLSAPAPKNWANCLRNRRFCLVRMRNHRSLSLEGLAVGHAILTRRPNRTTLLPGGMKLATRRPCVPRAFAMQQRRSYAEPTQYSNQERP